MLHVVASTGIITITEVNFIKMFKLQLIRRGPGNIWLARLDSWPKAKGFNPPHWMDSPATGQDCHSYCLPSVHPDQPIAENSLDCLDSTIL